MLPGHHSPKSSAQGPVSAAGRVATILSRVYASLLASAVIFAPLPASAENVYVNGFAGWSIWMDTKNHDPVEAEDFYGYQFGAEAGYEFRPSPIRLRLGLEGARRSNQTHGRNPRQKGSEGDGPGTVDSVMVNLWPSVEFWEGIHIYFGGGYGYGFAEFLGDEDSAMAFQVGSGVRFDISERFSIGFGYRYFELGDTEHDGLAANYDSHGGILELGWRF